MQRYGWGFFTESQWQPDEDVIGIAAVLTGTVSVALVAMAIAFPLAVLTALYISEYAPARVRPTLVSLVDLMAAIPSIVYGLWGFFLVMPHAAAMARWLQQHFGWIPGLRRAGHRPERRCVGHEPLRLERILRGNRRGDNGDADGLRSDAPGLLPDSGRREGGCPGAGRRGLQSFPFALDTLVMAVSSNIPSNAPAALTPAQIVGIYSGSITNWSAVGGTAGVIAPKIPQAGSGTRSFFVAQLQAANNGVAAVLAGSVTDVQEHDDALIKGDANAVAPFSRGVLPYWVRRCGSRAASAPTARSTTWCEQLRSATPTSRPLSAAPGSPARPPPSR